MSKLIIVVAAALGAVAVVPNPAAASCTTEYVQCLNDSYDLPEPFQTMADVECGAAYVGCVIRLVGSF